MIVRPRPSFFALLFILRGSIVPQIAPKVGAIVLVAVAAVGLQLLKPHWFQGGTSTPFTLVGLSLSIFLSFRNTACYDRWWEGRKLWGQLIVEARSLARMTIALFPDAGDAELRSRLLRRGIGFAYALEARLRGRDEAAAARPFVPASELAVLARGNAPQALLAGVSGDLAEARRRGAIGDAIHGRLEERLTEMAGVQAGCERIRSAPVPFAYTLLLHRTAYAFCLLLPFGLVSALGWWTPLTSAMVAYTLFGLDTLGDELEQPFEPHQNGLPLKAMARIIEIDLLTALGAPDIPPPLEPDDFVLL